MTNSVIYDAMYATHNGDYVNCVFNDLTYLANTNYYYYDGSFVNCVVANVSDKFFSGGTPPYTFQNSLFWNPKDSGPQTFYAVGSNGNIWANPLFRDAANGDYRLSAGSPCIDAGDGTLAPETDADGTPRVTDDYSARVGTPNADGNYVDVGAYEFADGAASSLDLEPVDLKAPTSAAVGETVTLEWTTRNNGSAPVANAWNDEIYLVSEFGREIYVATVANAGGLAAGDLTTKRAQVVVPNDVKDGDWRAVQTTQNVESRSQNIAVLYVPASDEARVVYVSFVASLGTTVGALTQNDDAFDVYGFADGQSFADSEGREYAAAVQLGQTSNVAIVGVGFQDGMTATLESVSSDGAFAVDASVRVASATSATLSFDMNVDATFFGNVYRLKVTQNGRTTTVDGLIYAKPKSARPSVPLVASLDIPDSIREGRVYKGCVDYQNVSSEVIAFPVFTVSGTAPLAEKKYDLYNRTLDVAEEDRDRAKKSLDALEELKKEIEKNGWELGGSAIEIALLFMPGGLIKEIIEIGFLVKDFWELGSSFQDPKLNKLFKEIGSNFTPYTSEFADRACNVFSILAKSAELVLKGQLNAARQEYARIVDDLRDLSAKINNLKKDFELAWKNLDKLTDPSSSSKVPGGYADWAVNQTDKALKYNKAQKSAAYDMGIKQEEKIFALKNKLNNVIGRLGLLGDIADLVINAVRLSKSIDDFHRFYEECNNNMFDFRDEVRKLSEAYPPQCTNPGCACHEDDPPKDEPRDDEDPDEPQSCDPNEILGPIGYDFQTVDVGTQDEPFLVITSPNWIDGKAAATQRFTIYFENKPTATAAAQEVFVETTLSEAFDWSTFELGAISVGNEIYDEPVGCVDGVWTVEQKSTGEQIQISVECDPATGAVKWYLRSYVASTPDHFPSDAYAGFLPPNDKEKGTGEGYVSFSVKLNDGLTSNTRIETNASIVFDVNEPIVTNTWLNTIDADAPTSEIVSIGCDETSRTIAVEWSGADVGSGIVGYDAYYSTDGGKTFELWLSQTAETSGLFALPGIGAEYVFKVVAFDGVGNASSGVTASITIESDDVIRWSESAYVVTEDCALRLSAEGSTGGELTYYWDLTGSETVDASNFTEGDATIWTSPEALGFGPGEYEIRLRVRDKSGIYSGIATATLRVETAVPIIDVRRTTTEDDDSNVLTRFDLAASFFFGRTVGRWTLNWGDETETVLNERSSAATFAHCYERGDEAKNYVATLKLTASDGEVYEFALGETFVPAGERVEETPSLVVTTSSDVVNATDGKISLREAILYAERTRPWLTRLRSRRRFEARRLR